jgi:hypothetical protein
MQKDESVDVLELKSGKGNIPDFLARIEMSSGPG